MNDLLNVLKDKITDPATLALVLSTILALTSGDHRLSAEARLEIQAELNKLTGGLL